MGLAVRLGDRILHSVSVLLRHGHTARVGVLDHGHGGLVEVEGGTQGGVRIRVVVVAHRLAVQQLGLGDPRSGPVLHIEGGLLMRVLAVAQGLRTLQGDPRIGREEGDLVGAAVGKLLPGLLGGELLLVLPLELGGGPGGDRVVIGGGVREGQGGQSAASLQVEPAALRCADHIPVTRRVHHHGHRGVVLRGGADHGGPPDVDLLHHRVLPGTGAHGVHERVEVDHHQVEGLHVHLLKLGHMVLAAAVGQDAGVHQRVQGLDPAVQALLEPGDLGDLGDGHARGGDALGGGPGGDDLHAGLMQPGGQLLQPGLVIHGDEGSLQRDAVKLDGHGGVLLGLDSEVVTRRFRWREGLTALPDDGTQGAQSSLGPLGPGQPADVPARRTSSFSAFFSCLACTGSSAA